MCEINWEIVQKFVSCLIWPSIVLTLFFTFKEQLTKLVNRIANESNAIDIGGMLKIQFKQIGKLKDDIESGQIPTTEQAKNVISATVAIQIDGLKLLGEEYKPYQEFEKFEEEDMPTTSDVTMMLEQYLNCLEKLRSDNLGYRSGIYYWVIDGEISDIKTANPFKFKR